MLDDARDVLTVIAAAGEDADAMSTKQITTCEYTAVPEAVDCWTRPRLVLRARLVGERGAQRRPDDSDGQISSPRDQPQCNRLLKGKLASVAARLGDRFRFALTSGCKVRLHSSILGGAHLTRFEKNDSVNLACPAAGI